MGTIHKPRAGTLQYWPRKRAAKFLPSVNWLILEQKHAKEKGLLGVIGYKVGMARYLVRDLTPDSMTKGKQIVLPVTLIECPPMRIVSIRFYRDGIVALDIPVHAPEKDVKLLKKIMKVSKTMKTVEQLAQVESKIDEFSDVRIVVYSVARLTGIKKTPDIAEIGLGGSITEKLAFIKEHLDKEIMVSDIFKKNKIVDVRGLTKGKGLAGPIKRFGLSLKSHKTEKGRRRPGSLGPWTPSRVTFRTPLAGQLGMFTRIVYNAKIIDIGQASAIEFEFPHYGKIKSSYVVVKGSVQGAPKRQLLLTAPLRPTKKIVKQNFELLQLLR